MFKIIKEVVKERPLYWFWIVFNLYYFIQTFYFSFLVPMSNKIFLVDLWVTCLLSIFLLGRDAYHTDIILKQKQEIEKAKTEQDN